MRGTEHTEISGFGYTWIQGFDRIQGFENTYGGRPLTPNQLIDIAICRQIDKPYMPNTIDIKVCQAPQKGGE